jgi:hypothetical protein
MNELLKKYSWVIVPVCIGFLLMLPLYKANNKPIIATVNVNAIMKNYVQKQAKLNVDSVLLQSATKAFVQQLEKEMKVLSDKKGVVLFVSEAVLGGAQDYTPELEKKVYQALTKTRLPA